MKLDAPFYTEAELDALYEIDPVAALRISREQHLLAKQLAAPAAVDPHAPLPAREEIEAVLEETRRILMRDGGDLELVELSGNVLRVRMKGALARAARVPRSTSRTWWRGWCGAGSRKSRESRTPTEVQEPESAEEKRG